MFPFKKHVKRQHYLLYLDQGVTNDSFNNQLIIFLSVFWVLSGLKLLKNTLLQFIEVMSAYTSNKKPFVYFI